MVVVAAASAVVVTTGGGSWWYLAAGPGAYTSVPDGLLTATVTEASALLEQAGLDVVALERFDATAEVGTVIGTEPAEDSEIRKGSEVTLTVSKGPDLRTIDVAGVGEELAATEAALTAAGLEPQSVHEYSDTVPAGAIIAMTLDDGTTVALGDNYPVGTPIVLHCSDGRQPVTVPAVIGMSRDQALAALAAAGLAASESQAYSPDVPAGVVKAQDPAAGAGAYRLDAVSVVVSLGPEPAPPAPTTVTIPSKVVGMTKFPALDLLKAKGFDARYERSTCTVDWAQCVVYKTVPAAGTSQPKGSKVTIWLTNPAGTEATMGTVPSLVGMDKYPAWDAIHAAGFNGVHYDEGCTNLASMGYEGCAVERQNPAPGTTLTTGSTVEIWLRNK